MKFFHLADLHLGKSLHQKNLYEDQKYVLEQVTDAAAKEQPDVLLIAGDIYNTVQTSADSIGLYDEFITKIVGMNIAVYAISGNHDSAEHLSFGAELFRNAGYYLSKPFHKDILSFSRQDKFGKVYFHLLPYVTKSQIKRAYRDEPEPVNMTDAMKLLLKHMDIKKSSRNVLLAHQYVMGAEWGDSETASRGGLDGISADIFKQFDYVALGHVHKFQKVSDNVCYAGTLLQYSFNEENNKNVLTVVDMNGDGQCNVRLLDIRPLHPLRTVKGLYVDIDKEADSDDYIRVILLDKVEIVDVFSKLRKKFPNLLRFEYLGEKKDVMPGMVGEEKSKTPMEHFLDFYRQQNGCDATEVQQKIVAKYLQGEER